MDFSTLPVEALHRYLAQYDLIPVVHPSPLSVHDPPPPSALLETGRCSSRAASPLAVNTPANRPRRESREQSRRRSSRLLEEEGRRRTPVLADVGEVQNVLARIAQRHFESQVVKEVDSLASFMCAVKGRVSRARFHEYALIKATVTVTVTLTRGAIQKHILFIFRFTRNTNPGCPSYTHRFHHSPHISESIPVPIFFPQFCSLSFSLP
jgi:Sin3 binding region of histone deacetylase complex subunit SAP30